MDFRDIIRKKPGLIWYVKDYDALDEASVVEAVLNYGDWNDVQEVIKMLGIGKVSEIFREYAFGERTNYRDDIRYYFDLYFKKHASRNIHS